MDMERGPAAWMAEIRGRVDSRLEKFFEDKRRRASAVSPPSIELVEAIARLTMRGGKRLRAAVLVCGFHAIEPSAPLSRTDDACAALELLQTYLLIHDDWMDCDDERRGGPSVHASFRDRYGDAHLGASLAVLAGDLAAAYAWELLGGAPFPEGRVLDGMGAFWRMQEEVVFGQHLDLIATEEVDRMQHLKTGSYTVRGPLRVGAVLANATAAQTEALERYGAPLGIAFQLRDDLLGTFGDRTALGKPTGSDLRAGKRTSLVDEASRLLSARDRAELDSVLGDRDADDGAVARVTELLVTSGARARVEERLDQLLREARAALDGAPLSPDGRALLVGLLSVLAVRDR